MNQDAADYDDSSAANGPRLPLPTVAGLVVWALALPLACLPMVMLIGLVLAIRDFFK